MSDELQRRLDHIDSLRKQKDSLQKELDSVQMEMEVALGIRSAKKETILKKKKSTLVRSDGDKTRPHGSKVRQVHTCSNCNQPGHSKRTCSNAPAVSARSVLAPKPAAVAHPCGKCGRYGHTRANCTYGARPGIEQVNDSDDTAAVANNPILEPNDTHRPREYHFEEFKQPRKSAVSIARFSDIKALQEDGMSAIAIADQTLIDPREVERALKSADYEAYCK